MQNEGRGSLSCLETSLRGCVTRSQWIRHARKEGEKDRPKTGWDGQKKGEGNLKDGKIVSSVAWKPNGEKCPDTNVVDGNGVVIDYNDDGTEDRRFTYKDGERVED